MTLPVGAQLALVASGKGSLFMLGSGPESGTHAHASAAISASANFDARYTLPIHHHFVGRVGIDPGGQWFHDRVTLALPSEELLECPCAPEPTREWLAGDYEVAWDGMAFGPQTLLVVGVDVDGLPKYDWPTSS